VNEEEITVDIYNFTGGGYDRTARFWIDENDLFHKSEGDKMILFRKSDLWNLVVKTFK